MAKNSASEFDFDDWAGLFIENPQEFEARRTAALMLEVTRGTPEQCAAGLALLNAYDKRVNGCDSDQRFQVAASMMTESVSQLKTELMVLKQALEDVQDAGQADGESH